MLDQLGIPYALGGSFAATFYGEPRSTMDIDVAIVVRGDEGEELLRRVSRDYVVPMETARHAILTHGSFNLLSKEGGMKIDLFVLGDGLLDRRQIERRIRVAVPGAADGIWVTAPEDQVLRKLRWYADGGSVSDRQWRDVLGILRGQRGVIDVVDLRSAAAELGLSDLLERALVDEREP